MADFIIGDYQYSFITNDTIIITENLDISAIQGLFIETVLARYPIGEITLNGTAYVSTTSQPDFSLTLQVSSSATTVSNAYCSVRYDPLSNKLRLTATGAMRATISTATYDSVDKVSAQVNDSTKSSYEDIPASVTYGGVEYSVTSMERCFQNCTSLIQAPEIPNSVTDMYSCFRNCTSLTQAPVIPSSVRRMGFCFYGCTSLTGDIYIYYSNTFQSQTGYCFYSTTQPITLHAMNDNIEVCNRLVATASNGNIFVNIRPETSILFTDAQMNYMTNEGLKTLSLQTNANLVQCEIPDLAHGGTITTNVNDALIDLYYRGVIVEYEYLVSGTVSSNGITITNNRDGSFTINGTARDYVTQPLLRVTLRPSEVYMMTGGYVAQNIFTGTYITGVKKNGEIFGGNGGVCDESISIPSSAISVVVYFRVIDGDTINNITIRPRIVKVGDA